MKIHFYNASSYETGESFNAAKLRVVIDGKPCDIFYSETGSGVTEDFKRRAEKSIQEKMLELNLNATSYQATGNS